MEKCKKLGGDSSPILLEEDHDAPGVSFHVGENTYDTVELVPNSTQRHIVIKNNTDKNNVTKKWLIIVSLALVISVLLGIALAIAFPLQMESAIGSLRLTSHGHSQNESRLQLEISNVKSELLQNYSELISRIKSDVLQNDSRLDAEVSQVRTALLQNDSKLHAEIDRIRSELALLRDRLYGHSEPFPVPSCASLPSYSPSGYYWVESSSGSAVHVYCDMDRTCGGVTGGWTRVANLDMSNNGTCPEGFNERSDDIDVMTCVKDDYRPGCSTINTDTQHINYTKVCGKIIAYQFGNTHAFNGNNLDSNYIDGISLTYGRPRRHIWSFASALSEVSQTAGSVCPCINSSVAVRNHHPPAIVGNDYFCDTGSQYATGLNGNILYTANPLWDGAGCGQHSTCCSFNNPPWFYKTLPHLTRASIEMRVCRDGYNWDEDIAIEEFYLFVQ